MFFTLCRVVQHSVICIINKVHVGSPFVSSLHKLHPCQYDSCIISVIIHLVCKKFWIQKVLYCFVDQNWCTFLQLRIATFWLGKISLLVKFSVQSFKGDSLLLGHCTLYTLIVIFYTMRKKIIWTLHLVTQCGNLANFLSLRLTWNQFCLISEGRKY